MSYALAPQSLTAANSLFAAPVAPVNAVTAVNPWSLLPPLGNLDAYISAVNRLPMLTLEQEQEFARKLKENNDIESAEKLVLSHLRLVVSTSRKYLGYGLPHGDLIQEGNIGLMKAVRRFDPDQGVRLVSYALHWIKAEMHEYILKNWRMVKVATTPSPVQKVIRALTVADLYSAGMINVPPLYCTALYVKSTPSLTLACLITHFTGTL